MVIYVAITVILGNSKLCKTSDTGGIEARSGGITHAIFTYLLTS